MSYLNDRDYYLQREDLRFLQIKNGQIEWTDQMYKAFNFHSWEQAEKFIEFLKKNHYNSGRAIELEVYRY